MSFGGIDVADAAVHVMADGRRFLVGHGDLFDVVVTHAWAIALLGEGAYELALVLNRWFNARPPPPRAALPIVLGLSQAEGEGRRELHRRLRGGARRRGPPQGTTQAAAIARWVDHRRLKSLAIIVFQLGGKDHRLANAV